jgi:tetratricopeptide (TPR) repeat protein
LYDEKSVVRSQFCSSTPRISRDEEGQPPAPEGKMKKSNLNKLPLAIREHFNAKRFVEALAALDARPEARYAAESKRVSFPFVWMRAKCLIHLGRLAEAGEFLRQFPYLTDCIEAAANLLDEVDLAEAACAERAPDEPPDYFVLSHDLWPVYSLLDQGRNEEAAALARRLIEGSPGRHDFYRLLAEAYYKQVSTFEKGKKEDIILLRKAQGASLMSVYLARTPENLYMLARVYLKRKRSLLAARAVYEAIGDEPSHRYYGLLAQSFFYLKEFAAAEKAVLKAIAGRYNDKSNFSLLVQIYYEERKFDLALAIALSTVEEYDNPKNNYWVARLLHETKRDQEALPYIEKSLLLEPAENVYFRMKLFILLELGRVDEVEAGADARRHLDTRLDIELAATFFRHALNSFNYGEFVLARQHIERAALSVPLNEDDYLLWVRILTNLDLARSVEVAALALEKFPTCRKLNSFQLEAWRKERKYEKVLDLYAADPTLVNRIDHLGFCSLAYCAMLLGRFELAIAFFRRVAPLVATLENGGEKEASSVRLNCGWIFLWQHMKDANVAEQFCPLEDVRLAARRLTMVDPKLLNFNQIEVFRHAIALARAYRLI